jgi:hypothetical protein
VPRPGYGTFAVALCKQERCSLNAGDDDRCFRAIVDGEADGLLIRDADRRPG